MCKISMSLEIRSKVNCLGKIQVAFSQHFKKYLGQIQKFNLLLLLDAYKPPPHCSSDASSVYSLESGYQYRRAPCTDHKPPKRLTQPGSTHGHKC